MSQQLSLLNCEEGCQALQVALARQRNAEITVEKQARQLARQMLKEWQEEYQPSVKELPPAERPTNRLTNYGPEALSTAEILAVIVGGPQQLHHAVALLTKFDGLMGLARTSQHELATTLNGIGPATAAKLKAAFELGRRLMIASPNDRPQVKSPADAANLLMAEMSTLEQEHLRTVILNTRNYVLKVHTLYVGSLNSNLVRVGEIFREAIRLNAAALIVAHNHPSGDPTPSPEDIKVTEMIVQAGHLIDIEVLDHIAK